MNPAVAIPRIRARLKTRLRRVKRRASRHMRRADPWPFFAIGIVALTVTSLVIILNFVRGGDSGRVLGEDLMDRRAPASFAAPSAVGRTPVDASLPGISVHVNDRAGYLFSYPDDWELSSVGAVEELTDPNGDVVMSFAVVPAGSLRRASDQVVAALSAHYSDLQVITDRLKTAEQGQPSSVLGATAVDEKGALIRLMVVIVRGSDQNPAITVRFEPGSDPLRALPDIQQIIGSFRTSQEM